MRVAIVAPPFIPVPPTNYGGTELFIAQLAVGLKKRGINVVLYATGDSTLPVETRSFFPKSEWPIKGEIGDSLRDIQHNAWAMADARSQADLVHLNGAPGVAMTKFLSQPVVYTIHHPLETPLSAYYRAHPWINYVCISEFQCRQQALPNSRAIHHGIELERYRLQENKKDYLCFLGRIAPVKGPHIAIEVAQKSGIPLKIAGQVQPIFKNYYESQVKPYIDGKFIEYVGEADLAAKNELLGGARAMLFPIQWHEPFGLVMLESMACGTPVLALPGGSVPEIVKDGVSGKICRDADEMAAAAKSLHFAPGIIRKYVKKHFSVSRMVESYVALYDQVLSARGGADSPSERVVA